MKNKILPIVMLVIFLVSLFPTALAQEEDTSSGELTTLEATGELTTQDESELEEVDDTNCWSDKPAYRPGYDKGFFIWQGTCGQFWWLDWSGDTRAKWRQWYQTVEGQAPTTEEPTVEDVETLEDEAGDQDTASLTAGDTGVATQEGSLTGSATYSPLRKRLLNQRIAASDLNTQEGYAKPSTLKPATVINKPRLLYPVSGRITTNGEFFDVGVRRFDGFDRIKFHKNVIEFRARVGPHFDGIFFRTTGDEVTFDLKFNGARRVNRVYIGSAKENPSSIPFTLTGDPATQRACGENELIYNNQCVTQIGGTVISSQDVTLESTALAPMTEEGEVTDGTALSQIDASKPSYISGKRPLLIKARQIDRRLVQKYTNIKQKFQQAQKYQANARQKFVNAKQALKKCAGDETEACTQVREDIKAGANDFLIRSADAIITHLEKVKNKIETNADLTDEEAAEMIANIDAKIQELEDAKAQVEAAETKEEILDAAKTIRDAWKKIKFRAVYWAGNLINARMSGILVKAEHLEERLMRALDKMEENGKDVSEIDPLIDEFHTLLTSARDNFESAKENYRQFKETDDKTYLDEGKKQMNSARKDLVAAHKKLKEIVRAIKATQGTEELEEATEETPIEEEETEEE